MLCKIYFLCIFALVLVKCVEMDSTGIKFKIDSNGIDCDHTLNNIRQNKYTALEGGKITLKTEYGYFINFFGCTDLHDTNKTFVGNPGPSKRKDTSVNVTKEMGTIWNCTILSHKDNSNLKSIVNVDAHNYTAAFCYMQVHVRRIKSPMTTLVNNMVVEQVRTNLSEKEVDYTVDYEYAEGDLVNVTCAAFDNLEGQFTMQYKYADRLSGNYNSDSLQSTSYVGISIKLRSGHNNTYMTCIIKESKDVALVKITLIMRSEFNRIVSLKINGLMLRPKSEKNDHYHVNYISVPNHRIYMECYVERADVKLSIENTKINKNLNQYKIDYDNDTTKIANFLLVQDTNVKMKCLSDYKSKNTCAEITEIDFTQEYGLQDICPLHIDLPPNGIVMELHDSFKRRVIYYEFEEGEVLTLSCYTYGCATVHYLKFTNSEEKNNQNRITKTLHLNTDHAVETCYVIEMPAPNEKKEDTVYREVKVIFRRKTFTTTTSTTLAPTALETTTPQYFPLGLDDKDIFGNNKILIAVGGVTAIVVIVVAIVIYKMIKRSPQRAPHEHHYENFQNQSTDSIPAHPVQWESTYAVPVDQRRENETYSVPVKPDATMYATPIPKSERNKQNAEEPTYASLDIQPGPSGRRNVFKDTTDATYSEVCSKLEECYAKVLPKSKRNVHDETTYANIAKESPYANTGNEPEPMYCDPNAGLKSQKGQYVNVNNAVYANRPGQEYVEPTYCEPARK